MMRLHRWIVRAFVVVGYPMACVVFWLCNPITWRAEVRTSAARIWRGEAF